MTNPLISSCCYYFRIAMTLIDYNYQESYWDTVAISEWWLKLLINSGNST